MTRLMTHCVEFDLEKLIKCCKDINDEHISTNIRTDIESIEITKEIQGSHRLSEIANPKDLKIDTIEISEHIMRTEATNHLLSNISRHLSKELEKQLNKKTYVKFRRGY